MQKPGSMMLTANIVGAAAILIAGTYVVRDLWHTEKVEPCAASYPTATVFNLQSRGGEPLTPIELQARVGPYDWGVVDKSLIENVPNAPASTVLTVRFPANDESSDTDGKAGIGFPWQPASLEEATAVCFAYDLWLPDGFNFASGGTLPGVGSARLSSDPDMDGLDRDLESHLTWNESGQVGFQARDSSDPEKPEKVYATSKKSLSKGRWQRLHQEIILNDPTKANGQGRLWIDGELEIDVSNIKFRQHPETAITTVLSYVFFGPLRKFGSSAPEATTIRISPLELNWR